MDAIELLESQHRQAEEMFSKIEAAKNTRSKAKLFEELADFLAIHVAVEEHQFYPAVKSKRTEALLREAVEEHLAVKRIIADIMKIDASDETFDAKVKVLKDMVEHHVEEEEGMLFPKVRELFDDEQLEAMGQGLTAEEAELEEKGEPRLTIPTETAQAAQL